MEMHIPIEFTATIAIITFFSIQQAILVLFGSFFSTFGRSNSRK